MTLHTHICIAIAAVGIMLLGVAAACTPPETTTVRVTIPDTCNTAP
ncbi:hypothetical protein [Mycolicibacterium fortuitum]|nr:hypothetical protein [Mycolicibacterium fortuitum]